MLGLESNIKKLFIEKNLLKGIQITDSYIELPTNNL